MNSEILDYKIRQLDIELHGGCNYECSMCPQSNNGREKNFKKLLPKELFFSIVDQCMELGLESISLHGSGEPTLCKYLPEAVKYCKDKGLKVVTFTNGSLLTEKLSKQLIDAGLDILRMSVIGYDNETYEKWMSKPNFELIRENAKRFTELAKETKTELHSYHLILNEEDKEMEVKYYKENYVDYVGAKSEVWMIHNWAGTYDETPYSRVHLISHLEKQMTNQRTCGRMFQPMLQVRAGGLDDHYGAVVSCCMTLGRDSEAVLGHLDTNTVKEIWNGSEYRHLRKMHIEGKWDEISYCKNCDQLYDFPESLVWTNIEGRKYKQSKTLDDLLIG